MNRLSRFAGIFGCAATVTIAGCAANTGISPTSGSTNSVRVSHVLQYLPTRFAARALPLSGIYIPYQNGPVLVTPKVYLIFWGYKRYGDPDGVARLLQDYVKAMGGSGHNNIYTQYYDVVSGETSYITNPKNQLGGVWFDNTNTVPGTPTDDEVAGEALNAVAKLGYDAGGSYVVATPHGHSTEGFGTQWCAYHSNTQYEGDLVSYTNLPYIPDAGQSCGAYAITPPPKDESAKDEGVTIVEATEEGESVTDPEPPTGWYNDEYGEINGPCGGRQNIKNDKFGKKVYAVGAMFSDASESCVQTYR